MRFLAELFVPISLRWRRRFDRRFPGRHENFRKVAYQDLRVVGRRAAIRQRDGVNDDFLLQDTHVCACSRSRNASSALRCLRPTLNIIAAHSTSLSSSWSLSSSELMLLLRRTRSFESVTFLSSYSSRDAAQGPKLPHPNGQCGSRSCQWSGFSSHRVLDMDN